MKNIILFLSILFITSCGVNEKTSDVYKSDSPIKVEHLMNEVSHGLYKVTLDDSTTILIYRGVESCTMLQLK